MARISATEALSGANSAPMTLAISPSVISALT